MLRDDTRVGERYWHETLEDPGRMLARGMGAEGGPDEPPKFKHYPDARRFPLPRDIPLRLGAVDQIFLGDTEPPDLDGRRLLAALLHYSYGLSRVDVGPISGWPFHRLVASARCFYPTEMYVHLSAGPGVAAGVYHYDSAHHTLVLVRAGDHRELIGLATGSDLRGADSVVILTSHLWKTAFRYRHYAYRLCTQEAGMVAGNVLRVASSLGLTGHLHYWFLDPVLDRLVGAVPGQERTMAVLPLYSRDTAPEAPVAVPRTQDAEQLVDELRPAQADFVDVPKDLTAASETYAADRAAVLAGSLSTPSPVTYRSDAPAGGEAVDVDATALSTDLADALRDRTSGGTVFRPEGNPVDGGVLVRLAELVGRPYTSDLPGTPLSWLSMLVQHSDTVKAGVYRCGGARQPLSRIAPLPDGRLDRHIVNGPPVVDLTAANAVCQVVTDRAWALRELGDRSFRVANMDAGVLVQDLGVLASAAGLASRPFNGYPTSGVQDVLGLTGTDLVPMFQVALGRRVASAQYEMPIVF